MRADCIQQVSQALGRNVTLPEMQGIEDRIYRALHRLSRRDRAEFLGMSRPQRFEEAARLAAEELQHEVTVKKERAHIGAAVHERLVRVLEGARAKGKTMFHALGEQLRIADHRIKGINQQYFSALMDTWHATNPRMLGLLEDMKGVRDLIHELYGKDSGNAAAKKGAEVWREVTETMRTRANAAGFDIRRRRDWHLPQLHDTERIRATDLDKFVRSVMPLLDRKQYLTPEGTRMLNDAELADLLTHVKETFDTGGVANLEATGTKNTRMLVKRRADPRELHFKDAESWLEYHSEYGSGSVFTAMQGHVAGLSRDIGLAESFGPNAEAQFLALHTLARKDAGILGGKDAIGPFLVSTDNMWKTISGHTNQIYNGGQPSYQRFAAIAQGVRNVETFGKLQGALLSSVTDIPTFFLTTHFNRLPLLTATKNLVRSFGGELTEYADRAGLVSESVISDMNRWGENNLGHGWTSRLANATLKASLLTAWTDAIKRAYSVTMMGGLGKLSRTDWAALPKTDREHLTTKGVTETDWKIYRLAQPESWKGQAMLTPEAIRAVPGEHLATLGDPEQLKNAAISRLLGAIVDESEYAAVSPDLYTRASLQRGTQRGSAEGELLRSIALFKSFPFAMISRHWMRVLDSNKFEGRASQVSYAATLATSLTVFGALAVQLKDLVSGKDPRDMTDAKFWGAAFIQGGGAGILGDFIYAGVGGSNRSDQSLWSNVLGPVAGTIEDAVKLTAGNAYEAAKGKDTHAGAEALRMARSHMPFANLWYLRTALDHAFMQDLQEYLSPGYLDRMKERARRDWGQDFWWTPGGSIDDARAPNFERVIGE